MTARATIMALCAALLVGAGLGAWASHHWDTRQSVPVQIAHHDTERAVQRAAGADTVYRVDTLTAVRWLTRYQTARVTDTVTVVQRDTSIVYVRASVADSTVHACRAVLSSCALAVATRDSVIAAQRVEMRAVRADRPSLLSTVLHDAAWASAGYVAGRLGIGAGVSLRVPFR